MIYVDTARLIAERKARAMSSNYSVLVPKTTEVAKPELKVYGGVQAVTLTWYPAITTDGVMYIPIHDPNFDDMSVDVLMYGYFDLADKRIATFQVCYYSFFSRCWYAAFMGSCPLEFVPMLWRYLEDAPAPLPELDATSSPDATGSTERAINQ